MSCEAAPSGQRPNILVCISDDMSWEHTSIQGDPVVKTPHFDRVSRTGVRFEHAYTSTPSCTPSRAALLSGQAFSRLEEGASLLSTLPAKIPLYTDLLEKAGYQVGATGKGWSPGDWRPGGRIRNPAGPGYGSFTAFLDKVPEGKPFCFWLGITDPHRPYDLGSGIRSGMDPSKINVPPVVPDSPEIRSDLADYLFEVQRFDRDVGNAIAELESRGLLTNTLIVVTSDNGMPYPRAKCNLYDWGTRMPLAIAWPGTIPPNRVISDFVSLTDLAPTFLQAAGVQVPGQITGKSLLPILLSSSQGKIEKERDAAFFGRERHDRFRIENGKPVGYPSRGVRTSQFLYIRNFKPDRFPGGDDIHTNQDNDRGPAKTFVVTHKDDPAVKPFYTRAYGKRPAEELYDLAKDPGQTNNVAGQRAYARTQSEMRSRLDKWMTEIQDPRRPGGTDPDIFDSYPVYSNPRKK
jgi:N-sulfoglucosamine sulfohydrolase